MSAAPAGVLIEPIVLPTDFRVDPRHTVGGDDPPLFATLAELQGRPELLKPPEPVVPRLAWRGRATALVAPDKAGKSTLAACGTAALSRGLPFLGDPTRAGCVVVVAPDEALGDTVRRLSDVDAHPDRVRVLTVRPPDPLEALRAALEAERADLVVVDSLAEFARLTLGRAPEDGDAAGWGAVVRPLVQQARDFECAVLVLHHPRRSDGQYRGSGEIAAAFDCLLEMRKGSSGEDPTLRRFEGRARWPVDDFAVRFQGDRFELGGGGEISIEARVALDVGANPGTSRNASHQRIGGRKSVHVAAVNKLLAGGRIRERSGGLYLASDLEDEIL